MNEDRYIKKKGGGGGEKIKLFLKRNLV
jgi:hypothetical protein